MSRLLQAPPGSRLEGRIAWPAQGLLGNAQKKSPVASFKRLNGIFQNAVTIHVLVSTQESGKAALFLFPLEAVNVSTGTGINVGNWLAELSDRPAEVTAFCRLHDFLPHVTTALALVNECFGMVKSCLL